MNDVSTVQSLAYNMLVVLKVDCLLETNIEFKHALASTPDCLRYAMLISSRF